MCFGKTALIPPTGKINNKQTSFDKEKAELFNRYFVSVFSMCEKVTTTKTNESLNKLICSDDQISSFL